MEGELVRDEGLKLKPYVDSRGVLSIGVGRNLRDVGITFDEAMAMLRRDIAFHVGQLDRFVPWWRSLDEIRQRALLNMAFNLGVGPSPEEPEGKLLQFRGTLDAIQEGDYLIAGHHLRATPWFSQVGQRGERVVRMIETGQV